MNTLRNKGSFFSVEKVLFSIIIFFSLPSFAGDYVISVFDSNSSKNLINTGHRLLFCRSIFSGKPASASVVRIQRTASYSVDSGVRSSERRGMQIQERDVENFHNVSEVVVSRLIYDWRQSGRYSEDSLIGIYNLHRELNPHRLKMITVEGMDAARPFSYLDVAINPAMKIRSDVSAPEKFSALRIYDSSPVMKSYGRKYTVPEKSPKDTLELTERVFKGFDLEAALKLNGIQRSSYTWSLGLVDVVGNQKSALKTLISQVADLLDLHYNQRDFLSFNKTDFIRSEDVDVVFYGSNAIRVYYKKFLGIEALKDKNGEYIRLEKNGGEFFVFHIKGSRFIEKFFDLRFHTPLYGNENGLRNEVEIRENLMQMATEAVKSLDPKDYQVRSFSEFIEKARPILDEFIYHQNNPTADPGGFGRVLGKFLLLRRELPDDIFDNTRNQSLYRDLMEIDHAVHLQEGYSRENWSGLMTTLGMLEFLMRDPGSYIINRSEINR